MNSDPRLRLLGATAQNGTATAVLDALDDVRVVVRTPLTLAKKARMETALVVSSAPWSITLSTSSGPMMAAVTCTPPVPQP